MEVSIEIQVPAHDADEIKKLLDENEIETSSSTSQNFDGAAVTSLIIILTPIVLRFLAKLYAERLSANKEISYKHEGFEIKGVSEETLLKILEANKTNEGEDQDGNGR